MFFNKPHPAPPVPATATPPPAAEPSLAVIYAALLEQQRRSIRTETRLVRLLEANGLDANGHPFLESEETHS